ncbi:alpha/beta hydrolase fold-domain-containing protein [Fomes fomentarius]|nr:alpha/beta hydrolase fold-domain-containing protein [Fomes fomentarius]
MSILNQLRHLKQTLWHQPPLPPPECRRKRARDWQGCVFLGYRSYMESISLLSLHQDKAVSVDGGEILARIIMPKPADAGGQELSIPGSDLRNAGWVAEDIDLDDNHLCSISVDLPLAVLVNVNYRRAPEHPFPTPLEDSYAALRWVVGNAADLLLSLDKGLIVGGDSAGGNISAAIALRARDDPFFSSTKITGRYLRESIVLHPLAPAPAQWKAELRSFEKNKNAPILTDTCGLKLHESQFADYIHISAFRPYLRRLTPDSPYFPRSSMKFDSNRWQDADDVIPYWRTCGLQRHWAST